MLFLAIASTLLVLGGAQAAPSLGLSVEGPSSVQGVDNFKITTTLKNTGDETLTLYADPRSALSSFPANSFVVTGASGASVPFVGARAKYLFKDAKNFVVLAPGESRTTNHDLSASYNFTQAGDYDIEAVNLFHYQDPSGNPVAITADAPSHLTAKLTGNLVSSIVAKRSMRNYNRASYTSCSSSRRTTIAAALPVVKTYVNNAVNYLSSHSSATPRYTTWFGTYSSSRKNTVLTHFQRIKSSDPSTYRYDCSCTEDDTYAYVYPNTFGVIYLCDIFWQTTTSGTDSRAGTIIHEASHFTANGGTQDYAYGQTNARALARSSPSKAIMNADSHEYFAENTPSLS
ncbi:hypothetical protein FRC17_010697 [Serendipita sp. 399]|nr:hypothetical protein FRC17_010697 [Serendipita sp. 399]